MAFNLRPSVLLQESSGSSQAARVRRVNDRRRSAAWLSDSQRYLGLDRGQTTRALRDRKSTRLNSSHGYISYAVFCLKKKIVVGDDGDLLVAVERHQRGVADRDRIRDECQALGYVGDVAGDAGHHKVDIVDQGEVLQR